MGLLKQLRNIRPIIARSGSLSATKWSEKILSRFRIGPWIAHIKFGGVLLWTEFEESGYNITIASCYANRSQLLGRIEAAIAGFGHEKDQNTEGIQTMARFCVGKYLQNTTLLPYFQRDPISCWALWKQQIGDRRECALFTVVVDMNLPVFASSGWFVRNDRCHK